MPEQDLADSSKKTQQQVESRETRTASAERFQGGLHPILQLQQTMGNRFVAQLIQTKRLTSGGKVIGVQRKLTVGAADGQYKQVADQMARQVVNAPSAGGANAVQRARYPEEDEGQMLQIKPPADSITPNNAWLESKEKPVQAKFFTEASKEPLQRLPETENAESADKLPPDLEANMEASFRADFSGVRIHQSSQADSLGALAYTRGSDIYFAPGQYDSQNQKGKELLGHELAHVVQQSEGRVGITDNVRGLPLNDDPALEREADELGAKAARGEGVGRSGTISSSGESLAQMKEDSNESETADFVESSAEEWVEGAETTATIGQPKMARPIQARALGEPIQRKGKKNTIYVPHKIQVKQPMTGEEYTAAAMLQVFGGPVANLTWHNIKDSYDPKDSPFTLDVEIGLLKRQRGEASHQRGIAVGEGGGVIGAEERAKTFDAGPESDEKSALLKEIDDRYFKAVGDETKTKIKPGEKGKAELWRMIRDEVLFQHEYITNLPLQVKELIKFSISGRDLTPADYDRLFAIAKKIENMPAGQASDYASKVTGTTTDLGVFEASLDKYIAEVAERNKQGQDRDTIKTKLVDLEEVYKKYREYKGLTKVAAPLGAVIMKLREELETQLKPHDFASIEEFEDYIKRFEKAFEQESAGIIRDLLAKYDGRLYREGERYKNPQEVSALHGKLGGYRSNLDVMKQSEDVMQAEYAKQRDARERSRLPGHGGTTPEPTEAFKGAQKKGEGAREAAKGELRNLASEHPILQDDEALPVDRRINKIALHTATETSLQGVLLGFIAQRKDAVKDARAELAGNSELIWKMDKMIPQFMLQQGIVDGSIHAQIIQDKMREDRIKKIVIGILTAIAAIALTVVSLGTATPAIVAAGAAAGAFGISAYMAYEEVKNYVQDKKLADVGLVDDPSIIWVVVAIAGAALDAGAAVKAIRAIGPLARAVNTGGDLVTFNKAVRALEEIGEIDAKIARAAERAAAAKKGYQEASSELTKTMAGKAYSFPGPFTDPDVYKALVKMARAKFKEIGNNGLIFIEEIKKARALAKLGEMTPEELAKVKQAWAEGKALGEAEGAFDDWIKQFPRKGTPNNTPKDAYEIRHTGPENIEVRGGGEKIWADGARSTDASLLEAKYITTPKSSPFISGSDCPQFIRDKIVAEVSDEFRRYGAVLNDPNTPAKALEVITNDQRAVPFFQDLLQKYKIPGQVVVKP